MTPSAPTDACAAIVNPVGRRAGDLARAVQARGRRHGLEIPIFTTTPHDPGYSAARRALDQGAASLIAVGGDGTVRSVVHAILDAADDSSSSDPVPLGVIPAGTGNLLALNAGLSRLNEAEQVEVALTGPTRAIDVAMTTLHTRDRVRFEPFTVMAGMGRDALAIRSATRPVKQRLGWLAYAVTGFTQAWQGRMSLDVQLDAEPVRQIEAWSVLAGVVPRVPPSVTIWPDACYDGLLHTLEVDVRAPHQWGSVALKGFLPDRESPHLRYSTARYMRIASQTPLPIHVDGDVFEQVHQMEIRILPAAIHLRGPQANSA